MLYRNIRTGRVIDVPSELSGQWEPVEAPAAAPAEEKNTEPETPQKTARKSGKKK